MKTKRFVAVLVAGWLGLVTPASSAERPTYNIARTSVPIVIDGKLDEAAWFAAASVGDFAFPWYTAGEREQTVAKLVWDDENLYAAFMCQDAHIAGSETERDARVYQDDCVEIFTAPNVDHGEVYFNIEMNVRGAFLDNYHPTGPGPVKAEWNASGITIATHVAGTLNNDADLDRYWILEAAIPLSNFADVAKRVPPTAGDEWRLNLNRLGGNTNAQHSQWSAGETEKPSFHTPDTFGRVIFSDRRVPFE